MAAGPLHHTAHVVLLSYGGPAAQDGVAVQLRADEDV
jgi:hypothetical protein